MSPSRSYVLVINDAPSPNERAYNALRLAVNLIKRPEVVVRVFLIGEGVQCALAHREVSSAYSPIRSMIEALIRRGEVAT